MAITFTQDDLDTLKEALVTGATEVSVQGRVIKYRSKDELLSLIKMIENALTADTSSSVESDFQVGGFSRKVCDEE